jgi:dihydroorotase
MMHQLIKNVTIVDPASPHNGQQLDVRLQDGRIAAIGHALAAEGAQVWDAAAACLSPGWVDQGAFVEDPGQEHREDLHSLARAAAAGGYTQVVIEPDAQPVRHDKSGILYVRRQATGLPVAVHPLGALSRDLSGKELSEMIDMRQAGALAFSNGNQPVTHAGLLLRALLYVKTFDGLVINRPLDESVSPGGQLHEGRMSTQLGMRGIPALAEELMIERDLRLLAYTDSRLHLANISTAAAVEQIRNAKKAGLRVTASVAALNLVYTDEVLADFDTHFKLMPPLRGEEDRAALVEGLTDGTIDWVSSNHRGLEVEAKMLEFPYADFGAIGLESAFGLMRRATVGRMPLEALIDRLAYRPRMAMGLPLATIETGAAADLTLFAPDERWVFGSQHIRSKSTNTPLIGHELLGRSLAVFYHQSQA